MTPGNALGRPSPDKVMLGGMEDTNFFKWGIPGQKMGTGQVALLLSLASDTGGLSPGSVAVRQKMGVNRAAVLKTLQVLSLSLSIPLTVSGSLIPALAGSPLAFPQKANPPGSGAVFGRA